MVDFWALPGTKKYLTKFYQNWKVSLFASQVLIEAKFWHQYNFPVYVDSHSLWCYLKSDFLQSITRPDGGSAFVEGPYLELMRSGGGRFLLLSNDGPYVGAWLSGIEGEPEGDWSDPDDVMSQKPLDAYTAVTGKRWYWKKDLLPNSELFSRLVISLDGNLDIAQAVFDGVYVPPAPPEEYVYYASVQTDTLDYGVPGPSPDDIETGTQIVIATASEEDAKIKVQWYERDGTAFTYTDSVDVKAHARVNLGAPMKAGSIKIVSTQPLQVYGLVYTDKPNCFYSQPGVVYLASYDAVRKA
jgi:hypothetical protein